MKRLAIFLAVVVVAGGASFLLYRQGFLFQPGAERATGAPSPAALSVQVAAAVEKPFPVEVATIGTVNAYATVALKARIDGQIMESVVKDGEDVKVGDLLFTIDDRGIRADLHQAEANLARDRALLASAQRDVARLSALVGKNYASKQTLDQTMAQAESLQASVRADEAAVDAARVQLSYTEIRAPINGRAGTVNLPRGNMVKANDTMALVVLNQLRPIYVAFSVPQTDLPRIRSAMAAGPLRVGATIPGDSGGPLAGTLTFIDNTVDVATGTILLKATFNNVELRLWPGQFVNVTLTLSLDPRAIVVPDVAVQRGQDGAYVYVVRSDSTVEMRQVTVARSRAGESVIDSGLAAGDRVVVDGQLRLAPGLKVDPQPVSQAAAAASAS
jgi:membrane fusion protein, multidrug efflux system